MADEREEGEGGFTIRDRRRFASETSAEPPVAAQTASTVSDAQDEEAPDDVRPLDPYALSAEEPESNELPDIYSVVALFLGEMRNHAILRLGLAPNPMTGQMEKDLTQARIAIDTAVFLGSQLESILPSEEKLPLQAMLSELQMLYVEQTKQS